jgi:hypothetical protein
MGWDGIGRDGRDEMRRSRNRNNLYWAYFAMLY